MTKIKDYLKKYKIPVSYIIEETGYHRTHISRVINGKKPQSIQFLKLAKMALQNKLIKQFDELKKKEKELEVQEEELNEALEELCQH